jgi:hypothetical protein
MKLCITSPKAAVIRSGIPLCRLSDKTIPYIRGTSKICGLEQTSSGHRCVPLEKFAGHTKQHASDVESQWMVWYLVVPLKNDGVADVHAGIERSSSVDSATPLGRGDARYLAELAGSHWPECRWAPFKPKRLKGRYVVKGKSITLRRKSR